MTTRTLFMTIKVGESLSIDGGRVLVTLEEKSGQRAKLKFEHQDVQIERPGAQLSLAPPPAERRSMARMGTKVAA